MNADIPLTFDMVVHLAYSTTLNASYDRAVTVDSVNELLVHFKGSLLKHFIYVGSMSIFGIDLPTGILDETAPRVPDNDYAQNKIDASAAAIRASTSFKVTVLHPTGVYSSNSKRLNSYREMLTNGYFVLDSGGCGINNIVHADDVASAILSCYSRQKGEQSEEYIITGESIRYSQWLAVIEQQIGVAKKSRIPVYLSLICRGPFRRILRAAGFRVPILMPEYKRAIFERNTLFLSDKAISHFHWRPCLSFKDTIDRSEVEEI